MRVLNWNGSIRTYQNHLDGVLVAEPTLLWQHEGGPNAGVADLVFSPDGSWLAAAVGYGEVKLWSADNLSAEPAALGRDRLGSSADLLFSPDGRWLVVGGYRGQVTLWSMNDLIVPVVLHGHATTCGL
jgi:WD40 repeat protein